MEQTLTPSPPSSASFSRGGKTTARRQSILAALWAVSSIKPYASSLYFRCIFAIGMSNLEERQQADVDVDNVKGVLRLCFGVNKDMVQVIANAAASAVVSMAMGGGLPLEGRRDVYVPTTTMPWHGRGEGGQAATKPTAG